MALQRVVEQPGHYRLIVGWDSIDDHMVHFRASDAYGEWRALVGHFFSRSPEVYHLDDVGLGF